jgi:drug/metabolite transporter (DMT)-like permease
MRLSGPAIMVLGYVSFGLAPVFVRIGLLGGWQASGAVVVRFLVALVLTAAIALAGQAFGGGGELVVRPVNRRGLVWRGALGGVAVITYFYSVQLVGAGLGALLNCTYSLWANVFGVALGRHEPDRWFWPPIIAALAGWLVLGERLTSHSCSAPASSYWLAPRWDIARHSSQSSAGAAAAAR